MIFKKQVKSIGNNRVFSQNVSPYPQLGRVTERAFKRFAVRHRPEAVPVNVTAVPTLDIYIYIQRLPPDLKV